jgi:hypothetical protein
MKKIPKFDIAVRLFNIVEISYKINQAPNLCNVST